MVTILETNKKVPLHSTIKCRKFKENTAQHNTHNNVFKVNYRRYKKIFYYPLNVDHNWKFVGKLPFGNWKNRQKTYKIILCVSTQ